MAKPIVTNSVQCNQLPNRILICGLGSIGRRHTRLLHQISPAIKVSALRSGNGSFSLPEVELITHHFSELETAARWNPDAAFITSPAPYHLHQALSLARHGIPLLIEKPLGTGLEPLPGWDELLTFSKHVPILVGYVLRHNPCASFIKAQLNSNYFGKVLEADLYCGSWLPDWRSGTDYRSSVSSQESMGGGALLELSHEIDLARFFFGEFTIQYSSIQQSGLLDIDVEDRVLLVGSGANCPSIAVRLNFCTKPSRRSFLIRCERAEIHWNLLTGIVTISSSDQKSEVFTSSSQLDHSFRLQSYHFFNCIFNMEPPLCTVQDGLAVIKLIQQARSRVSFTTQEDHL